MSIQFSVLIKPASSGCNLQCRYCFYHSVSEMRQIKSFGIMKRETAEQLILKSFAAVSSGTVHFAFQGGEPTLAGLEFYRHFTEFAEQNRPEEVKIEYSIQTNGVVVDDDWCALFQNYHFLVGLSLDGTEEIHDYLRTDGKNDGTFRRVFKAAKLMEKYAIEFNIVSVISKQLAQHPQAVVRFYLKNNFRFIQFIPCLAPLNDTGTEKPAFALTPALYASFLKDVFRIWSGHISKGDYFSIRLFDNIARMATGQPPEQCGMLGFCQPQFIIEADGGVYPCDFYVLDPYRCGDINRDSFHEIAASPVMQHFLSEEKALSALCEGCRAYALCRGGCKRYRSFLFSEDGYCPYQDFMYATYDGFLKTVQFIK